MLTAEQVHEIVDYTAEDLTKLIQETYTEDKFLTAKFLGINNTGKFVFSATYWNDANDCEDTVKVFVGRMDGIIRADY